MKGGTVFFRKSSVGATENAVLAAVCGEGTTVIRGCSKEPEVGWLCCFLNQAGARISGIGTSCLVIRGVPRLHDTVFSIPSDRITAGTYVCASAITRGKGILVKPPVKEMKAMLTAYEKIGGQYVYNSGKLFLCSQKASRPIHWLETQIYPGFPTDLQSIFLAVLACAQGNSQIKESIFEDRFKVVPQLQKWGHRLKWRNRLPGSGGKTQRNQSKSRRTPGRSCSGDRRIGSRGRDLCGKPGICGKRI